MGRHFCSANGEATDIGFGLRQVMRVPKGGRYGLIHPDGTPCDARRPENCPKMMGNGETCSIRSNGSSSWDELDESQKKQRISNAKQYLRMTEGAAAREAYNRRKREERQRREAAMTPEQRAELNRKTNERRSRWTKEKRDEVNAKARSVRASMTDAEREAFAQKKRIYNEIQSIRRSGDATPDKARKIAELKAYLKGLRKPTA